MYFVGKQEAETEVFLDRIIKKEGSKDRALLFIVSEIPNETKVILVLKDSIHCNKHLLNFNFLINNKLQLITNCTSIK